MSFQKKPEKKSSHRAVLVGLFAAANALGFGIAYMLRQRPSWRRLVRQEKSEMKQLKNGQVSPADFMTTTSRLLKDFFIPHQGNDHKPHALRPRSLVTYAAAAIAVKVVATAFLFFAYPSPAQLSAIVSSRMLELINTARAAEGVGPVDSNAALASSATIKGRDMFARQYFAHDTPDGKRPWEWIDRSAYDYIYAGENLAMDFTSAEAVQTAFMKSPAHRKNILNPKYRDVGIAVLTGELNGQKTILLVEFFGTQRLAAATVAATIQPSSIQPVQPTVKPVVSTTPPSTQPTSTSVEPPEVVVTAPPTTTVPSQVGVAQTSTDQAVAGAATGPVGGTQLESEEMPTAVITIPDQPALSASEQVVEYSNIFFLTVLIFLLVALVINIFVKINIQHSSVILQTLVVIAFLAALLIVKFHFATVSAGQLRII